MKAKIMQIIQEADNIKSFRFEKVFNNWKPGQWIYLKLDEELKHMFTISASPTEEYLQITTKFRPESAFKQRLWQLYENDEVNILGPHGSFNLDENDYGPRLFLAGGIGITPFRCMKKYIEDKSLALDTELIVSIKEEKEKVFSEVVDDYVITSTDGRLDEKKIKLLCPDFTKRNWWICGPAGFVDAMKELAAKMGIAEEKVRSEDFPGY